MNIPHQLSSEGGDLSFLDDGILHAFNPFPLPDWMFAGILIVAFLIFVISVFGIQHEMQKVRDQEFEERANRLGYVKKDGAAGETDQGRDPR